jgi:hypothetical protein
MSLVKIDVDNRQAAAVIGGMAGLVAAMKTDRYKRSVIEYAYNNMKSQFDSDVDAAALTDARAVLHHVYEWRLIGVPAGRLWRHKLSGRGGSREASFKFIASKTPILTPKERRANATGISGNDPIQDVPQKNIDRLQKIPYYFYWKAPIMEYGMSVYIKPVNAKRLFVPLEGAKNNFILSQGLYVGNPGGQNTGAFTKFWLAWWATQAPSIWDEEIRKTIEKDLGRTPLEEAGGRYRTKAVSLTNGPTAYRQAFEKGKDMAMDHIQKVSRRYDELGGAEQTWDYEEEW